MKSFSLGDQKMVYDRGRYKQAENVGSRSEGKGGGFLKNAPAPVREKAQKEIADRQAKQKEQVVSKMKLQEARKVSPQQIKEYQQKTKDNRGSYGGAQAKGVSKEAINKYQKKTGGSTI